MNRFLLVLFAFVIAASASLSRAQQLYSFEAGNDGFGANGGGVTVAQDTFGATDGTHSLKMSVVQGATFVGALTGNVPAALDPSQTTSVSFDLSLNPADPQFTTGFDVVGITVFGFNAAQGQFGLQAQFAPVVHVDGLAPGTYHETLALTGATNPLTFDTNQTFAQIFGPGPNQLTPSGFEFFLNKSNSSASTVYFDNVVANSVPEPTSLGLIGIGSLLLIRRRRAA